MFIFKAIMNNQTYRVPVQQQGYPQEGRYDQQQQYQQSQTPYNQSPNNPNSHYDYESMEGKPGVSNNFDELFKISKPKFNDWPFTIFFLLVVAGFIAVAGITVNALRATANFQGGGIYNSGNKFALNTNTVILFGFIVVVSLVLSFLIILYARAAPKTFITSGLILNVVLGIGTSIYYLVEHYYSAGIVFLVFTVITGFMYWRARHRIPFSAAVLTVVIDVMKRYPSTLVTSVFGILISSGFSVLFSVVIVGIYVKFDNNANNQGCSVGGGSCSEGKVIGLLVFVFFAGYYISEVIRNVIHVTIAGVYGTWYYLANSDQGQPRHPALGSLKRALTYCFGSVCFGSLIVSLIQLVKGFLQVMRQNAFGDGDYWLGCVFMVIELLVGFIEWAVQYFNHYAYCYVALYGKSYTKSAKDTFDLLRFKGMDALVNDCFISTSLNLYALFVGYVVALLGYLYLRFTKPGYNEGGTFYAPVIAFGFLISGQITRVALVVIDSGVSTFFVALAKDPEVFQMTNRDRFDEIFRSYPEVLQKITSDH